MLAVACGGSTTTAPSEHPASVPATGLVLLDLHTGAIKASILVGADPVAVTLSLDGRVAYIADSAPGDVYAVGLPSGHVEWKAHVGGAPFGVLVYKDHLYVSLYTEAAIDQLNPADGRLIARDETLTAPAALAIDSSGTLVAATGSAFGIALIGDTLWTADYKAGTLLPQGEGVPIPLPVPMHPFWLAPGGGGTLLIAAEGASEDSDPGAVFSYDPMTNSFATLARPRDPDQVAASGGDVFVAAHGDREVLRIAGDATDTWARGAPAVALAPDPELNLLAVAVNRHE